MHSPARAIKYPEDLFPPLGPGIVVIHSKNVTLSRPVDSVLDFVSSFFDSAESYHELRIDKASSCPQIVAWQDETRAAAKDAPTRTFFLSGPPSNFCMRGKKQLVIINASHQPKGLRHIDSEIILEFPSESECAQWYLAFQHAVTNFVFPELTCGRVIVRGEALISFLLMDEFEPAEHVFELKLDMYRNAQLVQVGSASNPQRIFLLNGADWESTIENVQSHRQLQLTIRNARDCTRHRVLDIVMEFSGDEFSKRQETEKWKQAFKYAMDLFEDQDPDSQLRSQFRATVASQKREPTVLLDDSVHYYDASVPAISTGHVDISSAAAAASDSSSPATVEGSDAETVPLSATANIRPSPAVDSHPAVTRAINDFNCGLRADPSAIGTVEGSDVETVPLSASANIRPSPAVDSHPAVTRAIYDFICGLRADPSAIGTVEGSDVETVPLSASANIRPSPAVDSHPAVTRAIYDFICGLRADPSAIGTVEGSDVETVPLSASANIRPSPAVDSHPAVTRAIYDFICGLRADATVASDISSSSTQESLFQLIIFVTFLFGFLIGLFSLGPIITGVCSLQKFCFPCPFFIYLILFLGHPQSGPFTFLFSSIPFNVSSISTVIAGQVARYLKSF
jgi:hypothetical protein